MQTCRGAGPCLGLHTCYSLCLEYFRPSANSFSTQDSAGSPPPQGTGPLGCRLALSALTFLHCNCLHTWLVCLHQIVSNLRAGICRIPHYSPRCTIGTP